MLHVNMANMLSVMSFSFFFIFLAAMSAHRNHSLHADTVEWWLSQGPDKRYAAALTWLSGGLLNHLMSDLPL